MKLYPYLIIVVALVCFGYLAYLDWQTRPNLVVLFGLLTCVILYRAIKNLKS